jgi:hypothetical protein
MPELPINITGSLEVTLQCCQCHKNLEAIIIVVPDKNLIVASIDTNHQCIEIKRSNLNNE